MLKFADNAGSLISQYLRAVLISKIVASLHGIEDVPFDVVLFLVAKSRGNAALRRARMASKRNNLADDREVNIRTQAYLKRRPETRQPGTYDYRIVSYGFHCGFYFWIMTFQYG